MGIAIEGDLAVRQSRKGWQEPHDCAGQADIDARWSPHEVRDDIHGDVADVVASDDVHLIAEEAETGHHQLGIAGVEQPADRARSVG